MSNNMGESTTVASSSTVTSTGDDCAEAAKQRTILELEAKLAEKEAELQAQNEKMTALTANLEAQMKSMRQNFAQMSHEIRTPLNCIVGMGSLLMDTPLGQFQQEAVRMIVSSGDLLSTVVDDVLDFSKLESGDFVLNIERVDLQAALDSVATAIQMKSDKAGQGLWIRTYVGTNVPQFYETDTKRLQQILYNLLGNAIKFSRSGAYIDLKCHILKTEQQQGKLIRFQVKDYGKGIAAENYEKIFLPFHQESNDTEAVYGGTGLGLPIVSMLAQKLGGTVSVQSEVGKWTEFTVDLPYHGPEEDITRHVARFSNTNILLVVARPTTDCPVMHWLREQGLSVSLMASCDDLESTAAKLETGIPDQQYYISLIHDEAFEPGHYEKFARNRKCQLISFGYKDNVSSAAMHVHSPCRVFPSLFLPILGDLIDRSKTGQVKRIETTLDTSIMVIKNQDPQKSIKRSFEHLSGMSTPYKEIRVLIAEDNIVNQKVLLKTLNRLGLEYVDIVDNGKKAVEAVAANLYDIVFMDMEMPVMNGLEACRKITKNKLRLLPIVVFVTAHAMDSFRTEANNAGGYSFISKPFNLEKINSLLSSIPWDTLIETERRTFRTACRPKQPVAGTN